MADRPNFLILMADQLTARALPAYGNRVAKTPHIDALAAAGVVFDSFYCNSPLCAPSRFSFLSGRQVSAIGAYDNAAEFPAQVPTFAHYLRQRRLPDGLERQDAFLRRGSAARIRRAPDHRHLSGRFRLDAGLEALRASAELVSHHGLGDPGRAVHAHQSDRLRRRGGLQCASEAVRHGAPQGSAGPSAWWRR